MILFMQTFRTKHIIDVEASILCLDVTSN
jgi:hypothetical protein